MKKLSILLLAILLSAYTASPATEISISPTGTPDSQPVNIAELWMIDNTTDWAATPHPSISWLLASSTIL